MTNHNKSWQDNTGLPSTPWGLDYANRSAPTDTNPDVNNAHSLWVKELEITMFSDRVRIMNKASASTNGKEHTENGRPMVVEVTLNVVSIECLLTPGAEPTPGSRVTRGWSCSFK